MIKKTTAFALFLSALVLSGCAATQRLSDEDRAGAKKVAVSPKVVKGKLFVMPPSAANAGFLFGMVGGAGAGIAMQNNQDVFSHFIDQKRMSIEAIVYDEFTKALRESGKLAIAATDDVSAPVIKLSVIQYGFGVTHLASTNVVPVLKFKSEMTDRSGKLMWTETDGMGPSIASPMEAVAWSKLENNQGALEAEWRKAAHYLAVKMIATL